MTEKIIDHYQNNYGEENRLIKDNAHCTEYLTTIRYFDKLFAPGSRILDACAGPGRYSFYLADKGHKVTACDLVPGHVDLIKANPNASKLEDVQVCNTLDLSCFADNSFDVVLCMGALYHLWDDADKQKAVEECVRVCKPGGIVALAYVGRAAAVLDCINEDASNIGLIVSSLDNQQLGVFVCVHPDKIENLALGCGLEKLHHVAVDGMVFSVADKINAAMEENFQKYMEYHYSICEDPCMLGASMHGLWFGRK